MFIVQAIKNNQLIYEILSRYYFKMSNINHPNLASEIRPRANSRFNRNYQKVSQTNIDDSVILSYLKAHHMHHTQAAFLSQLRNSHVIAPILQQLDKSGQNFNGNIESFIADIKGHITNRQELTNQKMITAQFYLHIWYCVGEEGIIKTRIKTLKQFIQGRGQTLTQIPELLAYFALPYSQNPSQHPFLKRIFTQQWRKQLQNIIGELLGQYMDQAETIKQHEWLNIIKDMIEICNEMIKQFTVELRNGELKKIIDRVNLYKTVIEDNREQIGKNSKKQRAKQHSKEGDSFKVIRHQYIDTADLKAVQRRLNKLNKQISSNYHSNQIKHQLKREESQIYYKLSLQLQKKWEFGTDKQYVLQLLKTDILLISHKTTIQISQLKLMQCISSYYEGRNYFVTHPNIVQKICQLIISEAEYLKTSASQTLSNISNYFELLQKLTIRSQLFQIIIKHDQIVQLINSILYRYQQTFTTDSPNIQKLIASTVGLATNLILHRQGRHRLSHTSLFDIFVAMLKKMHNNYQNQILQSMVCSAIYLMLVQPHLRQKGNKMQLRDIILERMMFKQNESYVKIVQYIIQRLDAQDIISQVDSDQDQEKDDQFDQHVSIACLEGGQQHDRDFHEDALAIRNANLQQKGYVHQKYAWKNKNH